jgi:hypothetical protein
MGEVKRVKETTRQTDKKSTENKVKTLAKDIKAVCM